MSTNVRLALLTVLSMAALAASSGEDACRAQSQSYSRCRLLAANGCLIPPEEIRSDEKMLQAAPSPQGASGQPARAQRLLVITDAQTNTGELDTERVVKGLEPGFNAGVRLTAIGVGLDYNDALLSRLTRIPGNNGRFLDRADEIGKSLQVLFDALLPLEVDKPQLTLELPANVTVKNSFGTTFTQPMTQPARTARSAKSAPLSCWTAKCCCCSPRDN
jgi:hypothetical protein